MGVIEARALAASSSNDVGGVRLDFAFFGILYRFDLPREMRRVDEVARGL